ncbi:hypothetical protein M408DRAFT_60976 [Serendipita vermifera MAFF 305830]|uniref:DRBM domain-containing protein n=1 Tax=Serendipita vermifera MAFF 305830 TaxID=933852 RepID=A0A0C3BML0_SERVB|nr:hypothetical protein M408DRAFT_60976 [Serendipita vermifera MAFF 305830]
MSRQELTYRARINNIKQKYKLDLDYEHTVYGPSQAHVWCGAWVLNNRQIGTGESRTKDGAKEDSAKLAFETLVHLGFRE